VTAKQATFQVHQSVLEVRIAARPERVWRALVEEASSWWHRDFYTGANPRGFHFEPVLGGRMWEDWGDGQGLVWGTVIGVRHNEFLQVSGLIDASFGGPAGSISTWRLAADAAGTTLRFEGTTWGAAGDATQRSLDVGWKFLIERCFKGWIETGQQCTDPAPAG
jgi:uncharacterized protein YndB with AHSA1/START domain